jgi:hypothetical protein
MKKESAGNNANKSSSSMQGRARNPGRKEGFDSGSGYKENTQGNWKDGRKEGFDNASGYKESTQGNWKDEGNTSRRGCCLPKLFMLLLPFVAAGAVLFLR